MLRGLIVLRPRLRSFVAEGAPQDDNLIWGSDSEKPQGSLTGRALQVANPDCFGVGEFADAVGAEFAAVAGGFHAAERETGVGGDHGIDEDQAGFEVVDEALALGGIVGPGAGAQAEAAVVGDAQGVINVFHAENAGDGAEEFLAIGGESLGMAVRTVGS